jgi:hypothetical protein
MHPWFMKFLAIAFAGGSAVLLACAVHDDTSFPNSPQPTSTKPPTRTVVFDSGVVTLLGEAGVGPEGVGSGGQFTPDAAPEPDVAPALTLPDGGGPGAPCDVFNQSTCSAPLACFPNLAEGTQTCQDPGNNHTLPIGSYGCVPSAGLNDQTCVPGLVCVTINSLNICTNFCHRQNPGGDCLGSISNTCHALGKMPDVGDCE